MSLVSQRAARLSFSHVTRAQVTSGAIVRGILATEAYWDRLVRTAESIRAEEAKLRELHHARRPQPRLESRHVEHAVEELRARWTP